MSGKRYKGKLCVYCGDRLSVAGDHVFAREFFTKESRTDLPQVPACETCNNEKSKLEHYLTAILPFGGKHAEALVNLAELVPSRLNNNSRLKREIQGQRGRVWHSESGIIRQSMTVPFDSSKCLLLFGLIAKGLAWHHWGILLKPGHSSSAMFLSKNGTACFDHIFSLCSASRVRGDLGMGTVAYAGIQATDVNELTLWRINFYGGIAVAGDPRAHSEISTEIAAITGPNEIVGLLEDK